MKRNTYSLNDAIRIITSSAKDYEEILKGNNYIFIYRNRNTNCIEFFESVFLARNFQHLTGIEYIDDNGKAIVNSLQFYQKCVRQKLKPCEIRFRTDGTTALKLTTLPLIINFLKISKMTAIYNGSRPKLTIDRLAGTTNFCLGFTYDKCGYYVPSSALCKDIRKLSNEAYQILAVFSKKASRSHPIYRDIRYVAKGVPLNKLTFPDNLKKLISLENYRP